MPQVAAPYTPLIIQAGDDWGVPITIYQSDGVTLLEVDEPTLEMRRDPNPAGQLLAHFDTSGDGDGLLTDEGLGQWAATLPWTFTAQMPTGNGFWNMVGFIGDKRILVASGVVEIIPRVVSA